jgi:hypothetical protein
MTRLQQHQVDLLARRQLCLVSARQLAETGLSARSIARAVSAGRLVRFRRGVYLLPGHQPTWETAVMAAVLAAGEPAVASHLTAARLWALEPDRKAYPETAPEAVIHLSAPRAVRLPGVVSHIRNVPPAHRSRAGQSGRVPATSAARTLVDLSAHFEAERLGRCVDEALRRRIVRISEVVRVYDAGRGPGRRRLSPIHQVLAERVPGFDPGANDWERKMDDLWDEMGLPQAVRQYEIRCGNHTYRVDRAIVELRLAVEWVGVEYHGQVGRFRRDRRRISDLALAGWDLVEVTSDWTEERIRRTVFAKAEERRRLLQASAKRACPPPSDASFRPAKRPRQTP